MNDHPTRESLFTQGNCSEAHHRKEVDRPQTNYGTKAKANHSAQGHHSKADNGAEARKAQDDRAKEDNRPQKDSGSNDNPAAQDDGAEADDGTTQVHRPEKDRGNEDLATQDHRERLALDRPSPIRGTSYPNERSSVPWADGLHSVCRPGDRTQACPVDTIAGTL
jgi:hypothetical protein